MESLARGGGLTFENNELESSFGLVSPTTEELSEIFTLDLRQLSLMDQILFAVEGIDTFLLGLEEVLDGEVFGFALPLVGDKLSDGAHFIGDFRDGFLEDFRRAVESAADGRGVNNALAFPGLFRGALDARAKRVNNAMKIAAAKAVADLADEGDLVPNILDLGVHKHVASAVEQAALKTGVVRFVNGDEV